MPARAPGLACIFHPPILPAAVYEESSIPDHSLRIVDFV